MDPPSGSNLSTQQKARRESSNISIIDLRARRVQISAPSNQSVIRAKTVKDSVIYFQNLSDTLEEPEESILLLPTSLWELVMHRWKTIVGTGVLAMPYAFAHSGWLVGILCVIVINAGFRYCFQACLNIVDKVGTTTQDKNILFPEAMGIAFELGPVYFRWLRRPWKYIWYTLSSMLVIGVCGTYILFIAVNMAQIYQDIDITWSIRIWMLLVYVAITIISAIPNMRRIVPFTIVAAFLQSVGLVLIMFFLVTNLPPLAERDMTRPIEEISIFIGIVCFAGGPITFIVLLDLKTKFSVTSANLSALLATLIYSLVGFFGYWKYGNECLPSITLNLPTMWEFPEWIRLLFILGVFLLYINHLQNFLHPIWFEAIAPRLRLSPMWKHCCKYLFRLLFITLTTALVQAIPRLGYLMSTCAICTNILFGFVFVPIAEFSCFWPDRLGRYNWRAVKNIAIIIVGSLMAIPGFLNNLYILYESLQYGEDFNSLTCKTNVTWRPSRLSC